jgi:RNA polymerase-associated protein RTF1
MSSLPSLAVTKMQTSKKVKRECPSITAACAHRPPSLYLSPSVPRPPASLSTTRRAFCATMKLTPPSSSPAASSPNSLGSDAMDESDSDRDDDAPERTADVPYPLEGKYIDDSDKRRIMGMSQLEREEILGQRAEETNRAQFQAELARRAAQDSNRKRKADSEEPDDAMRKSSRPKVQPRKNDKLEAYKREREQRGQQRQRQDDRRQGRRRSSSGDRGGGSDIDADGESDVEWDDRPAEKAREEQPASIRDFESVRVGRGFFSEVCFYPGFEEAMTGTFGRVGVGQDSQRRTLYKMAQIKGQSPRRRSQCSANMSQASLLANPTSLKARMANALLPTNISLHNTVQ